MPQKFSNQQIKKVIENTLYPKDTAKFVGKIPNMEGIHRNPEKYKGRKRGNMSKFFSDKCNRLIICESNQERELFLTLEKSKEVLWYQEQPMKIKYSDGKTKYYYPDVAVLFADGRGAILEVKTNTDMLKKEVLKKAIIAKKHLHNLGVGFGIVDKYGRSYRYFFKQETKKSYESAIIEELKKEGSISVESFQKISKKYNIDSIGKTHFPSYGNVIVKNDLCYNDKIKRYEKLPNDLSYDSLF